MIIQAILVLAAIVMMVYALGRRNAHSVRAWKKIALILLSIGMIVTVLYPELTNYIARTLGVGRGADLLIYILAVSFIFYALNNYMYQQTLRDSYYKIARKIAIDEALNKYKHMLK